MPSVNASGGEAHGVRQKATPVTKATLRNHAGLLAEGKGQPSDEGFSFLEAGNVPVNVAMCHPSL
jgi:hypothetical protein